jgi:guanidinopropionase
MRILWNLGNCLTILIQYFNLETMAFKLFGNYLGNSKAFEHESAFGQRFINSIYPKHLSLHRARNSQGGKKFRRTRELMFGVAITHVVRPWVLSSSVNPTTKVAPYRLCNIADVGDAPTHPLSVERSVELIQAFYERIHAIGAAPISIGGDHTVPLPILRAIAKGRPLGLIQIDSHTDTFDEFMGTKCNHATFVRCAVEEGLLDPKRILQIGLRGTRYGDDDINYGYKAGIRMITMDEFEEMGRAAVIEEIRRVVGDAPTYITIDIDGLDPRDAPGTGVPEPGGISMRDAQMMLRTLTGMNMVGGDICEVVPSLDPTGITCINAANLMFELTCLAAVTRSRGTK